MKNKLFIIVLIGLCMSFSQVNSQTSKNAIPKKVSNVPAPGGASCLDNYLNFCDNIWNIMSMGIQSCGVSYPHDPDANIACNTYYTDGYLAMHGVADAMYDRCKSSEGQQ